MTITYPLHLATREPADTLAAQTRFWQNLPHLTSVFDAIPNLLLILNRHRQIVYANRHARQIAQATSRDLVCGLRPGELLDCENAPKGCHGCGTAEECSVCGAAGAIGQAEQHCDSLRECHLIQRHTGKPFDFRVSSTPLDLDGQHFILLSLTDITAETWHRQLERVFFHDLLNTAGALREFAKILPRVDTATAASMSASIATLSASLVEEIQAQRDLQLAEQTDVAAQPRNCSSLSLVRETAALCSKLSVAHGRQLRLDPHACDVVLHVDKRILTRILTNMIKNALEASTPAQPVTLSCDADDHTIDFRVHNLQPMTREVQLQVFQRSFSTKGQGRGLGTYSMKLLGTRVLGGKVGFTSNPDEGTTFHISLPLRPAASPPPSSH